MDNLGKLIEAVEAGDNRFSSYLPSGNERAWPQIYKAMDGSLDAAKALHDAVLPGWWFAIDGALASVSDMNDDDGPFFNVTVKGNPARAWLIAILKAYRSTV